VSSINHHVSGVEYWRSLEQLAQSPEIQDALGKEFPGYDADTISTSSRRAFMKLMGAAMALAGVTLTGCRRWPKEQLAPYSSNPREHLPGIPEQYATTWELNGVGHGLIVNSFDGRPIKIEGNPSHPASWVIKGKYGSADALSQATLLEMYDPERTRSVVDRRNGLELHRTTSWEAFLPIAAEQFKALRDKGGEGFAVLSEASASPSVLAMREAFEKAFPEAKWYEYEPISLDNEREGARLAFGAPLRPILHLDKAQTIVSLDGDFLLTHPNHTRYSNDWSRMRRSADTDQKMNRVYIAESVFSITGTVADVRLGVDPARIYVLARALAGAVKAPGFGDEKLSAGERQFVSQASRDLLAADGNAVVTVGHSAPPEAHAVAFAINAALGAIGKTITFIEMPATSANKDRPTHLQSIAELTAAMNGGQVNTLLLLGGNPSFDAPADVPFAAALAKVPTSMHLTIYDNETSKGCKWLLPRAHYLECWGDSRSWDGTPTLAQPIIEPLFGGKSVIELLAFISNHQIDNKLATGDKIVRQTWAGLLGKVEDFDKAFRGTLETGLLAAQTPKAAEAQLKLADLPAVTQVASAGVFTLRFTQDSHAYDGRFANNGWLQETPDPLSKLMWDNAALMSVADSRRLGIDTGDMIEISVPGVKEALKIAAFILPGQPVGVVGVSLGFGRISAGHIGDGLGFNAYPARTRRNPWSVAGIGVKKTGDSYVLIGTQEHHIFNALSHRTIEARVGEKYESGKIIREATLAQYIDDPRSVGAPRKVGLQLFQPPTATDKEGRLFSDVHAWGMSIDMNACIGCNACALACQAENNIPIVGKAQCSNHREMNWIRIDRYFKGDVDDVNPEVVFQPMLCQHCENAPCEQVCPVAATVHDSEGLNTMVYNRCIGTRYCSNNCPYKVRRFNYFDYHAEDPRFGNRWLKVPWPNIPDLQQLDPELVNPVKRMMFNPDVTVRMRGVMEKCTFCVQRIHGTVIAKRREGPGPEHDVRDGDILTACQQACPTQAIVFGNLKKDVNGKSQVADLHKHPRAFDVLQEELNTIPRIRYLAKLRNPAEENKEG